MTVEEVVINSGPIPEFLRNKNLPELTKMIYMSKIVVIKFRYSDADWSYLVLNKKDLNNKIDSLESETFEWSLISEKDIYLDVDMIKDFVCEAIEYNQ